nr:hypothetical protein GCM10020093_057360 [Planobispora longispora]
MRGVDAGVQDGDLLARAGDPGLVHLVAADHRQAVGHAHPVLAVLGDRGDRGVLGDLLGALDRGLHGEESQARGLGHDLGALDGLSLVRGGRDIGAGVDLDENADLAALVQDVGGDLGVGSVAAVAGVAASVTEVAASAMAPARRRRSLTNPPGNAVSCGTRP